MYFKSQWSLIIADLVINWL